MINLYLWDWIGRGHVRLIRRTEHFFQFLFCSVNLIVWIMQKRIDSRTKTLGVNDYLNGMSYREVAQKYGVDHKVVMWWVKRSGNESRSKELANLLMSQKTKGQRRNIDTEFKKGIIPWNKDTQGIMKSNKTSFKKGEHFSTKTEFKGLGLKQIYPKEFNGILKEKIKQRDNYICQNCGISQYEYLLLKGRKLGVHHINYDKSHSEDTNLITLCKECHALSHIDKDKWQYIYGSKLKMNIA